MNFINFLIFTSLIFCSSSHGSSYQTSNPYDLDGNESPRVIPTKVKAITTEYPNYGLKFNQKIEDASILESNLRSKLNHVNEGEESHASKSGEIEKVQSAAVEDTTRTVIESEDQKKDKDVPNSSFTLSYPVKVIASGLVLLAILIGYMTYMKSINGAK